jgi:hypothetical protein
MDKWKPSFAKKPFQFILGTVCWNLCPVKLDASRPPRRYHSGATHLRGCLAVRVLIPFRGYGLDLKGLRPGPLGDGGMQKDFTLNEAFCVPLR